MCFCGHVYREDATLISEDMYRELRRQKWEEQEQQLAEREGDIHYQDIRFDGRMLCHVCVVCLVHLGYF